MFPTIKDALAYSATTKTLAGLVAKDPKLAKAAADPTTNVTLFVSTPPRRPRGFSRPHAGRARPSGLRAGARGRACAHLPSPPRPPPPRAPPTPATPASAPQAPVDSAFTTLAAVPAAKALLADPKAVSKILAYHAAAGARIVPDFKANGTQTIDTLLAGQPLTVSKSVKNGVGHVLVTADSAGAKPVMVRKHNIIAGASFIDVVDGVLVPKL